MQGDALTSLTSWALIRKPKKGFLDRETNPGRGSESAESYEYFIKKNEIMPFAATLMDLRIMILSEVSQKKKNECHMITHVESKKNGTNQLIYKTETDSQT